MNILDYINRINELYGNHEPRTMDQAALVDELEPGSLKDELLNDFDPSQETYEEYLQRKRLGERPFNMAEGGRIGLGGGGFVFTTIRNLYKGKKGLQEGAIRKKLVKEYKEKGASFDVFKVYDEAKVIVDDKKLDIVQDAMTKVDIRSDDYIRLMDEQIRLTDYELYKDIKRWDEYRPDLSAKVRARHDPYWAESNFGENYDEVLLRNQAQALKAQSDEIDRMYPDSDGGIQDIQQQTVKEIDEMNKANIAEVIEGKKKHAIGGRVGYNDGQLVTPSVDGSRPGYQGKDYIKPEGVGNPAGTIFGKNLQRLENLKKIIESSNSNYKKTITATDALKQVGWKKGWQSIGTKTALREEVKKILLNLNTTVDKMNNYVDNVMFAENALVKNFQNPGLHLQKKFGVSVGTVHKWKKQSQVYKDNKKIFDHLSNNFAFDKYKLMPDGTPRLMSDFTVTIQNKLPSAYLRGHTSENFIMNSAYRHYMQSKALGKTPNIFFIGNPELQSQHQWKFIKDDKLFSTDPSLDVVEFQGKPYKNNYLNHVDAAKLYEKDFGKVYKMFDELENKYMKAEVIDPKTKKPIKLDTLLRRQAYDLTGKKGYLLRRFMEIDHGDILNKPFDDLRLMDRTTNVAASNIKRQPKYKNNPKLLKSKLDEIGYNRKFNNTNELITFYSDRATGTNILGKNFQEIVKNSKRGGALLTHDILSKGNFKPKCKTKFANGGGGFCGKAFAEAYPQEYLDEVMKDLKATKYLQSKEGLTAAKSFLSKAPKVGYWANPLTLGGGEAWYSALEGYNEWGKGASLGEAVNEGLWFIPGKHSRDLNILLGQKTKGKEGRNLPVIPNEIRSQFDMLTQLGDLINKEGKLSGQLVMKQMETGRLEEEKSKSLWEERFDPEKATSREFDWLQKKDAAEMKRDHEIRNAAIQRNKGIIPQIEESLKNVGVEGEDMVQKWRAADPTGESYSALQDRIKSKIVDEFNLGRTWDQADPYSGPVWNWMKTSWSGLPFTDPKLAEKQLQLDYQKIIGQVPDLSITKENIPPELKQNFLSEFPQYSYIFEGASGGRAGYMGGGIAAIRKPHAIPPERQGLRSIMINVNDD